MKKARLVAVVDDEQSVLKALNRLLRSHGIDVVTFAGGQELLDAMTTFEPECIVLDLHMPGTNGFDVLETLAQAKTKPPIVVITGHDTPEARARTLSWGAFAYLPKPVDERLLLGTIAAAIAGHEAGSAAA